jgi:hypothetical protein
VLLIPLRPLSRNSRRLPCVPTATMSSARFSWRAGTRRPRWCRPTGRWCTGRRAAPGARRPGARPSVYAWSTSSVGGRRACAFRRARARVRHAVHVAEDQVGDVAVVQERVRASVHAHEHGRMSRMYARRAARSSR